MKKEVRNRLIASLILSSLFSIFVLLLISITSNSYLVLVVPFLVLIFELLIKGKQDPFVTLLLTLLLVLLNSHLMVSPFILSFLMLFVPVYYFKDYSTKEMIEKLGFRNSLLRAIIFSIISLVPLFVLYVIIALISNYLGLDDSQQVVDKVLDLPVYLWAYAVIVAPLVEEVFFRSFLPFLFMSKTRFLSPLKSEIVSSFLATILFSLAHFSYGSVFELLGTFFLGYALYVTYRVSNDIKVPIIIHMIINLISIIAMHLVM